MKPFLLIVGVSVLGLVYNVIQDAIVKRVGTKKFKHFKKRLFQTLFILVCLGYLFVIGLPDLDSGYGLATLIVFVIWGFVVFRNGDKDALKDARREYVEKLVQVERVTRDRERNRRFLGVPESQPDQDLINALEEARNKYKEEWDKYIAELSKLEHEQFALLKRYVDN